MLSQQRMVVLDDDPTGIQTVHGCLLVTTWSDAVLRRAFSHEQPFFYILTNTRALTADAAAEVTRNAMEAVVRIARQEGYRLIVVSRSDSCLRGHFPVETDVMERVLTEGGMPVWPTVPFCPALIESGRVTIEGVHYMKEATTGRLIPIAQTEFARDNVFAYHSSDLREYIAEKGAAPSHYEVVNAQDYDELNAWCEAFFGRIAAWPGAVVVRSSSSLPRALSGIAGRPLLTRAELGLSTADGERQNQARGLFVVGSHVSKTSRQLSCLLEEAGTEGIELPIAAILNDSKDLMEDVKFRMADCVARGVTPVVYTERGEVRLPDVGQRQRLGQQVSDFLVDVVRRLPFKPAYVVAKGGITSHDILTHALGVEVATCMGQVIANVPCVMTERFPYIIFPGNVGQDDSLVEIYRKLEGLPCKP